MGLTRASSKEQSRSSLVRVTEDTYENKEEDIL